MSKADDSELLEILITGHEVQSTCKKDGESDYEKLLSTFGSHTARKSASSAIRPPAKKGILKRGVALRRASSFSIGTSIWCSLLCLNPCSGPHPAQDTIRLLWEAFPLLQTAYQENALSWMSPGCAYGQWSLHLVGHNGEEVQLQGRAGLQWQHEKPSPPLMTFKQQWDALPPLPEFKGGNRTRSLQTPVMPQGTATPLAVPQVRFLAPSQRV